jgi:hypothetical protein
LSIIVCVWQFDAKCLAAWPEAPDSLFVATTIVTMASGLLIQNIGAVPHLTHRFLLLMLENARNEVHTRSSFSSDKWYGTNVTGPVIHNDDMTKYNSALRILSPVDLDRHTSSSNISYQHLVWLQAVVPLSLNKALYAFASPIVNAEFHHMKRCATDIELVFLTMLDENVLCAMAFLDADHTPPADIAYAVELRRPQPLMAADCGDGRFSIFRGKATCESDLPVFSKSWDLVIDFNVTTDDEDDDDGDGLQKSLLDAW